MIGRSLALWLVVGLFFGGIVWFIFLGDSGAKETVTYLDEGKRLVQHLL
ncbi:hypothetical protein IJM86_05995 [bacterium]|nr:hypothetical protein [bacterium]